MVTANVEFRIVIWTLQADAIALLPVASPAYHRLTPSLIGHRSFATCK